MNKSINAAVYEKHGNPADVLHVDTRPWPTPAADEAVVKMLAAPINPADINQIEGKYPVRPALPATPGFEGAGIVVELGANVKGLTSGALVILPHNVGTWRDAVAVKAEDLVVIPEGIEPVQAAMLKINPLTAWVWLAVEVCAIASGLIVWWTGRPLYPDALYPTKSLGLLITQTIQITAYAAGALFSLGLLAWTWHTRKHLTKRWSERRTAVRSTF